MDLMRGWRSVRSFWHARGLSRATFFIVSVVVALWMRRYFACDELAIILKPDRHFRASSSEGLLILRIQKYSIGAQRQRINLTSRTAANLDYLWIEKIDRGPDWLWSFQAFTGMRPDWREQ